MNIVKSLINKRFSVLTVVLLSVMLTGCGSQGEVRRDRQGNAIVPEAFTASGKLSLRPQGESKIKGFTANYRWIQTGESYDLELWGALGQGRTRITGTANRIEIVDGTGRKVKSRHPERLLKRHLGWSLPLSVLPYWLQGQPAPAPPNPPAERMRFQPSGDLASLNQIDWALEFSRYSVVTGLTRQERLPGRVRATSDQLKLTVVAREWSL